MLKIVQKRHLLSTHESDVLQIALGTLISLPQVTCTFELSEKGGQGYLLIQMLKIPIHDMLMIDCMLLL